MFLLVGLGNIGKEYEETRHNCGFLCVDEIIKRSNITNHQIKFKSDMSFCKLFNNDIIIAKPQTFMNNSGNSISLIKNFYKIPIENIFVFHDDLDLDFCKIKYKVGGGSGGHNGLKSLDEKIGKNYHRIRIGIGKPENKENIPNYVLKKFNNDELKKLSNVINIIVNNIDYLFSEKKDLFINNFYLEYMKTL